MKSKDGKPVPSRIWYYLLDWNEEDEWQTLRKQFEVDKLRDLSYRDLITLFIKAQSKDVLQMSYND